MSDVKRQALLRCRARRREMVVCAVAPLTSGFNAWKRSVAARRWSALFSFLGLLASMPRDIARLIEDAWHGVNGAPRNSEI
jgi:hypothetical protein